MTSHRVDVVVFTLALTVFGLVALALVWSGGWAYEVLARATGHTQTTFLDIGGLGSIGGGGAFGVDLHNLLSWHGAWASYVVGLSPLPSGASTYFSADEVAHMADVRAVFRGAELAAVLALFVGGYRISRARRRDGALRLVRAGALVAAGIVAAIGVAAALAFDQLFLLFHDVFFPQGNFLFDPATSNLLRLYPEWYWQGITAGVGLSFIALALLAAWVAHSALRRGANTYTRAA